MLLINLYGAPGAGKSTGAAYIFSQLKLRGINAELVTEFAKDKVYEESTEVFRNQAYIFGKQYFRLTRCMDKVDVIVTDSPLLLSTIYNESEVLGDLFNELVFKVSDSFNSKNFFINRVKKYNPSGRFQTEEESNELSDEILEFLLRHKVPIEVVDGNTSGYDFIVNEIVKALEKEHN